MALVSIAELMTPMRHVQGAHRPAAIEFPPRLDDYLAAENPVRFMEAVVDALDLEALGVRPVVAAATGRPSEQPGDRLTRDIDGDLYRVRSSRRLAQETQRHVERMWLLHKLRPDHNTIAPVRRDHLNPRRDVCRTWTWVGHQLDRCGGELVALEGRQVRAVNATGRHLTTATLAPRSAQIDARVEGSLTERAAADEPDEAGTPGGARAADLQPKIAALRARRRRSKDLQAEWAGRGQAQRSLTAPDRRAMHGGAGGGPAVCEHVQTAVEAKHTLLVACDVTHDPTDRDWLSPMAGAAQAVRGGPCAAVADVGDDQGQDVQPCLPVGMTPASARPITSAQQQLGLCSPDEFTSEAAADTYGCPAGEVRSVRFAPIELGRHLRDDATSACRPCRLKAQCTRNNGGRRITRWVDEPRLEQMEPRVHARPESMKQRTALVEHPLGTMKRSGHQGYVLMRDLAKVRAECRVTVVAYNLGRVLNRVDMPRLLASLGSGWQGGRGGWWARRLDA